MKLPIKNCEYTFVKDETKIALDHEGGVHAVYESTEPVSCGFFYSTFYVALHDDGTPVGVIDADFQQLPLLNEGMKIMEVDKMEQYFSYFESYKKFKKGN